MARVQTSTDRLVTPSTTPTESEAASDLDVLDHRREVESGVEGFGEHVRRQFVLGRPAPTGGGVEGLYEKFEVEPERPTHPRRTDRHSCATRIA